MAKKISTTTKPTPFDETIEFTFRAIGTPEVSVGELADHIKTFVAKYKEDDIETLKRRVNARLVKSPMYTRAINPKTKNSKRGVYRLVKTKKPVPILDTDVQKLKRDHNPINVPELTGGILPFPELAVEKLYFGKAGEFAVASELLFRGYNASIMSVDEGIDITASKNDRFCYIQVKTTHFENGRFSVPIKRNRFVANTNANVYYVIVIRQKANNNRYFILPEHDLTRHIATGHVNQTDSGVTIKVREENGQLWLYHGDQKQSVEYHLDNFTQIR